jgi:DNA (cytosine-5)-methyltransferase 1
MKILNLYCGIGGNRKLWGNKHEITAVELNPKIAKIYKDFFPNDNVIVGDAHEYLRKHFREFDFIWASPPCQTHSDLQMFNYHNLEKIVYPDMKLYQEIILLRHFYSGNWVVENVKPYYKSLIEPSFKIDRHYFWSNKFILTSNLNTELFKTIKDSTKALQIKYKLDLKLYRKEFDKIQFRQILRNYVLPEIGKYIFEQIRGFE